MSKIQHLYLKLAAMTALLLLLVLIPRDMICAANICVRQATSNITVDGVVAPGAASTVAGSNCPTTAQTDIWRGVGIAKFQPATTPTPAMGTAMLDGNLFLAYREVSATDRRLFIGIDLAKDGLLSDRDVVVLLFDATNDGWGPGDFYLKIRLLPTNTRIENGVQCAVLPGSIEYYSYVSNAWRLETNVAAPLNNRVRVAYDFNDTIVDKDPIAWNLEIDMPLNQTIDSANYYGLQTSGDAFAMGAYLFVDNGVATGTAVSQGQVLDWGDLPDRGVGQHNMNILSPDATKLVDVSLDDVCYNVTFNPAYVTSPLMINNQAAREQQPGDIGYIQRNNFDNKFKVTFYFDGPGDSGTTTTLSNPGTLTLGLTAYRASAAATAWEQQASISDLATNQTHSFTFDYNFSRPPASFGPVANVNFICATGTLAGFPLDDDTSLIYGENMFNVNHNRFANSEVPQEFYLFGDSLPGLNEGETGTVYLQVDMNNEMPDLQQSTATFAGDGSITTNLTSIVSAGSIQSRIYLGLLVIGLLVSVISLLALRRLRRVLVLVVGLVIMVAAVVLLLPDLQRKPPITRIGTGRWSFTNAEELGITPVEGQPNWYQMPIDYGEVVRADLLFTSQPLPYEPQTYRLEAALDGSVNWMEVPVTPGSVVTVLPFGEVDLDGEGGELEPISAIGFNREVDTDPDRPYLLRTGYYSPNEFSGALIGTFETPDGFFVRSNFVIGGGTSILVPDEVDSIWLAVNAQLQEYQLMTGGFDLYVIETGPPTVPNHAISTGDATYNIPPMMAVWDTLTTLNVYTYYRTDDFEDGTLVSHTMHPWGSVSYTVYHTDFGQEENDNVEN